MNYFKNIRNIALILISIICFLLIKCNKELTNSIKIKDNNIIALNSKVLQEVTQKGNILSSRNAILTDYNNLSKYNKSLEKKVKELKDEGIKTKSIIVTKTRIVKDTVQINSTKTRINDSTYTINFKLDTVYNKGNSRKLEGTINLRLYKNNGGYDSLSINNFKINKEKINMDTKLVLGERDNITQVWVQSNYPGFNVDSIDAVVLDENLYPANNKVNSKRIVIGPFIGISFGENLKINPTIGIGITYSIFKF